MKILIVDDEKHIRRLVGDYLKNEGYDIEEAKDGYECIDKIVEDKDIDLILLDVRMPKMNGYETIKEIRMLSDVPVIYLTANDDSLQEVKGIELGAFDYITKPFSYEVLVARVKSCLMHTNRLQPEILMIQDMKINMSNREIYIEEKKANITTKEFDILEALIRNKNKALERGQLLDMVWGFDYYGDPRTVDTHIKTLRSKMGDYGKLIKTVRGIGYYIEMD